MVEKTGVIYLMKDKFQFYSPYDGKIFEFRFVSELIRDLDVINSGLLENYIKAFITSSRTRPSNLVFVLAENAYFSKDFFVTSSQQKVGTQPEVTKDMLQKQADEFIEHVPFDNVVSKTIPIKDGIKVCATNKDFYETVAIAFEHNGFTVESVVPATVLGNGLSLRPVLDQPLANLILQKINGVRQYNLLNQQVFQPPAKQETEEVDEVELEHLQPKKPDKKRLYSMIGVLFSLIIVLVIVYEQSQVPSSAPKQNALASTTPAIQQVTPVALSTVIPTTSDANTTPSEAETANLSVQIINASDSATAAQNLQGLLDTYKFQSISLQTQSPIGSSGSLVSFGSNVTQDVRDAVLTQVKKFETNIIVQDQKIGDYDISIVLGQ